MGGGEVMYLAADPTHKDFVSKVRGFLLEGPFIGFAPELAPSTFTVVAGRLVGKILPHRHMVNRIPPESVTRDPVVAKDLAEDDLCHDTGTLEGLSSMLDRTNALTEGKARPGKHVQALWLGHGTDDKGTSFHVSKMHFLTSSAAKYRIRSSRRTRGTTIFSMQMGLKVWFSSRTLATGSWRGLAQMLLAPSSKEWFFFLVFLPSTSYFYNTSRA